MFKQQSESPAEKPSSEKETKDVSSKPPRPSSNTPSIIGGDVQLKGNLSTTGEVQFDGRIEGDLECGSLTIGETAEVTGGVLADTVVVHGTVIGKIRAKRVRLERSSKMIGDVWHEDISIESGAHIEGQFVRVENALDNSKDFEAKLSTPAIKSDAASKKDESTSTNGADTGQKAAAAG